MLVFCTKIRFVKRITDPSIINNNLIIQTASYPAWIKRQPQLHPHSHNTYPSKKQSC